jgi:hypothetical protein
VSHVIIIVCGIMIEAAGMLGRGRNWYADLLVGAGGIIAGSALHGPLGAFITIMGVICILERAADAGFAVTG